MSYFYTSIRCIRLYVYTTCYEILKLIILFVWQIISVSHCVVCISMTQTLRHSTAESHSVSISVRTTNYATSHTLTRVSSHRTLETRRLTLSARWMIPKNRYPTCVIHRLTLWAPTLTAFIVRLANIITARLRLLILCLGAQTAQCTVPCLLAVHAQCNVSHITHSPPYHTSALNSGYHRLY